MPGDRFIELALDKGRHVLDVLFMHASEAVTIQDQSGGIIYANDRAATLLGLTSGEEMLTRPAGAFLAPFDLIDPTGEPLDPERLPGRQVLRGEPVAEQVVGYRDRESGETRWSRIRSSPVKDDSGRVVWAINFFSDITAEVVHEHERELLSRARDALSSSLELDELVIALTEAILPDLGSWAGVHLIDDGGFLVPVASRSLHSRSDEILIPDPERVRMPLDGPGLEARVARTGRTEVVRAAAGAHPEVATSALSAGPAEEGPALVLCAPLRAGDRLVGTLSLGRRDADGRFNADHRRWIEAVAERAGVTFANALLYAHERETAEVLQRGLVPTELPPFAGLRIASRYQPQAHFSGVGGDFFDVLVPHEKLCLVAVGDIEGKGIPAAAAVGVARHTLRATAALNPDPEIVIGQMNEVLGEQQPPRLCTLAYLRLEPTDEGIDAGVSLAGHPPPMIVRSDGRVETLGEPCPPLGFLSRLDPAEHHAHLQRGDTIVVYTDGFAFGSIAPPETLQPLLQGAHDEDLEELLDRLLARLQAAQPNPRDDVVLLAIRVEGATI